MTASAPVVVGVDGSDDALHAVRWGIARARRLGRPLRLVHAFPWPLVQAPGHVATGLALGPGLRAEAQKVVDEARALVPEDQPVRTEVHIGFAAPTLLAEAEHAESVLVGSHGLGGVGALLIGSTGVELAARAPCPVIVLPYDAGPDDAPRTIVIGDDGSAPARDAIAFGRAEAAALGVPAVIIHAGDDRPPADAGGVPYRTVHGHPAHELITAAGDTGMIVVGSRGRGGFRGLLLGSTSQTVLHHARCAVAVVHAPPGT